MRNELVVSFFLCIGLTSGYIVPSSVTELLKEKNESDITALMRPHDNKSKKFNVVNLKNTKYTIQDSEILSQSLRKPNNINGRSFIFIRQKYRSPMLNLFHSQIQNPLTITNESTKSRMKIVSDKFKESNRRFSPLSISNPENDNAAFKFMSKAIDKTQGILLKQLCSGQSKLGGGYKINSKADLVLHEDLVEGANKHREYYELLKTPVLTPNFNEYNTPQQECVQHSYMVTEAPLNLNHEALTMTQTILDLGQNFVKKYDEEDRLYKSKNTFYRNEILHHHESRENMYKISNNVSSKQNDEAKSEKYLKTYLEMILNDKRKPAKESGKLSCHDCASRNLNYNTYPQNHCHCKCGHHVFSKEGSNCNSKGKEIKRIINLLTDKQSKKIDSKLYGYEDRDTSFVRNPRFG